MRAGSGLQLLQGTKAIQGLTFSDGVYQVYAILDEIFLAGEIEETSKDVVLSRLEALEKLE